MSGQAILQKAAIVIDPKPTTFKTGSDGFRGQGKVTDGDERYQVQFMAVRIGSGNGKGKSKKS
jgi:hypothetical protein